MPRLSDLVIISIENKICLAANHNEIMEDFTVSYFNFIIFFLWYLIINYLNISFDNF